MAFVPAILNGAAVIAATVCFAFAGDWPDDIHWGFVLWGSISTLASLLLTALIDYWRRANKRGEVAEAALLQIAVSDAIQPLVRELATIPPKTSMQRERALVKIIGQVGTSLKLVLPEGRRIRIVVYRVKERAHGGRELIVESSIGRNDRPKKFVEGDGGRGDAAFTMLEAGESIFVADLAKAQLPGWQGSGKGYRTFISSPIVADARAFGMLTVDAPRPGDLDETDKPLVDVIAGLLAIAFAEASRAH